MVLKENMLLNINDEVFRVLDVHPQRNVIFIINMEKNIWPQEINTEILNGYIDTGVAKQIDNDEYKTLLNDDDLTELMLEKRDFAFEIVNYIYEFNQGFQIYVSKYRGIIIKDVIKKYCISYNTVKKYLICYLKAGKTKIGLVPKSYLCGGRGKNRKVGDTDIIRGRQRRNGDKGVNVDEKIIKYFKKGINKYYNTDKQNSIKTSYELTIRDYLKDNSDKTIPSLGQFYYWFQKLTENNKKHEISNRYGDRIYPQKSRGIVGSSLMDGNLGPSSLYQVDSTVLDLYTVSSLNRNIIVGRPNLFLILDVYSHLIVGINLTLESFNAYIGVMGALINAMSEKQSYCARYGVVIDKKEWDVSCVPSRIMADRGELLSGHIEGAISNIGILIQNTAPFRGDQKGIVESSFKQIHAQIKPFIEGYVENGVNKVQRGSDDYRLKANLTLDEVTKIIIKCILFYNNYHVLSSHVDEVTIEEGIPKIPSKIWEYGIKKKRGLLRILDDDFIKLNLLQISDATVKAKGVFFRKLFYVSKLSLKDGWFEKARRSGSYKIKVSYDSRDLSQIYYIKDEGKNFDRLVLVDYMDKYKTLCEEELEVVMEYENKLNEKAKQYELKEKIKLFDELEGIAEGAKQAQNEVKDKSISKSKRLSGIQENLEKEREFYREAVSLSDDSLNFENKVIKKLNKDNIDLFSKIQDEVWSNDYE